MSEPELPTQTPPSAAPPVSGSDGNPAPKQPEAPAAPRPKNKYFPTTPVPRSKQVMAPKAGSKNKLAWVGVYLLTAVVIWLGYYAAVGLLSNRAPVEDAPGPVKLGKTFYDQEDFFRITPPINWEAQDRIPNTSIIFTGPPMKDFIPILVVCREVAPGSLEFFLREYKLKLEHETPSIKWLSDQATEIHGKKAQRLEFEYEDDSDKKDPKHRFMVRCVQWVIDDNMVFYRITGSATATTFKKHLPKFEASAETFTVVPPPTLTPSPLKD